MTGRAGWSIRRRLLSAYAVFAVLAAAGLAANGVALAKLDTSVNLRAGLLQPDRVRNAQLLTTLVDQETGVRGYAVTGTVANLDPYEQGVRTESTVVGALRSSLHGFPVIENDVQALETAAAAWRAGYVGPLLAAVRSGGPPAAARVGVLAGKPLFDAIRTASATVDSALAAASRSARAQITRDFTVLVVLLTVALTAFAVAASILYRATRRWVLLPLDRLGRDARSVAGGDLERRVGLDRAPPDVLALAADVDAMRRRLLEELAAVESARAEVAASSELVHAQAADLARSNRDLEQFAYVASHDLQEPLRKVASFCQLLERRYAGSLDERGETYIAFAVDGAKRMQQLINDLLAFSRVGRSTDRFASVPLQAALDRAVASLDLEAAGVALRVGPLPAVRGDLGLLTQLFQNLLGNAVKFRAEAEPVITISAHAGEESCEVAVTDNGIGIDAAYAEKIFVIFQRLHGRDVYGGTGIGLALCRRIVEFHGGRIWLDTDHTPPGTTFRFTLLPATGEDGYAVAAGARQRGDA